MENRFQLIENLLEQLQDQLNDIEVSCDAAVSAASSVQDYASEADNQARIADGSRADAWQTSTEIAEELTTLKELVLRDKAPSAMDEDIRKHRKNVMHHHNNGHSASAIASSLSIAEILVTTIIQQSEAQAA